LSAPRRSAAIPNHDGTKALYTVSTYSFTTHSRISEIKIFDIDSGESQLFTNDSDEFDVTWIGNDGHLVWFKSEKDDCTSLNIGDTKHNIFKLAECPCSLLPCSPI